MKNYYTEKGRAYRHAINYINEEFYNDQNIPRKIFLRTVKMELALDFGCNYEKIFLEVMEDHMKGDKRIIYNKKKECWSVGK